MAGGRLRPRHAVTPSIKMKSSRRKGPKLDVHGLTVTRWANAVGLPKTRPSLISAVTVADLYDVLHVRLRLPCQSATGPCPKLKALWDWIVSSFRDSSPECNGSNCDISVALEKPLGEDTVQVRGT